MSRHELSEMFGYVSEEDRAQWDRARERNKTKVEGTAKSMVKQSMSSAIEMGMYGVDAQLKGAYNEQYHRTTPKTRKTTTYIKEEPVDTDYTVLGDDTPEF